MSRKLMWRALLALEFHQAQTRPIKNTQVTIDALRDALGQQAKPQGHGDDHTDGDIIREQDEKIRALHEKLDRTIRALQCLLGVRANHD